MLIFITISVHFKFVFYTVLNMHVLYILTLFMPLFTMLKCRTKCMHCAGDKLCIFSKLNLS